MMAAVEALPADRIDRRGVTEEGWSAKDVMFHVAAWLAVCARQLERMRTGTYGAPSSETGSVGRTNREWAELSATLDVPTVRTTLIATRVCAMRAWTSLPVV